MLLEFRIQNFRSIKDEQSLRLVAAPADKELADTHLAPTGLNALPQAVRSAVPYGANASGKSTGVNPIQLTPDQQLELKTKVEFKMKQIKKDRLLANDIHRMDNLSAALKKARKADDQLLQFELSAKKTTKQSTAHKETTQVITQIS